MSIRTISLQIAAMVLGATCARAAGPVEAETQVQSTSPPAAEALDEGAPHADDGRGTPYIVDRSDNICGLDEPRHLSRPAKVDYDTLLDLTPQVRLMKKEKIDRNSARGIQLMNEAEALVRDTCETVRVAEAYCSVWKKIERRDKRDIPDLTDQVKKSIEGEQQA